MAQVRKFSSGGSTKPKYGRIIINGEVVNDKVTDNDVSTWFGSDEVGAALKQMITSGQDIRINNHDDYSTIEGLGDHLDPKTKISKKQTRFSRAFENRQTREGRDNIDMYVNRNYSPAVVNPDTYNMDAVITLKKDKDGKIIKDVDYTRALDRMKWISGLKDLGIDFKSAKLNSGNSNLTWDDLLSNAAYSQFNNDIDTWTESDIERAKDLNIAIQGYKNTGTDPDKKSVDLDGDGEISDSEKEYARQNELFKANGLDINKIGSYIVFDKDGNMRITENFVKQFGPKDAAYNEFWRGSESWTPDDDWLFGYSRIGNKLYRTSDIKNQNSELWKLLNNKGFFEMNRGDNYTGANEKFEYLWGPDDWNTYNKDELYWDEKSGFNPEGLKYRPVTGVYEAKGMPRDTQILEYYTPDVQRDEWGRPVRTQYGLFDKDGNFIKNVDENSLSKINGGKQIAFNGIQSRIYDPENTTYHGRIKKSYSDDAGNYIRSYWSPEKGDIIVEMSDLSKWDQLENGAKAFKLTPELSQLINKYPDFWNKLLQSKYRENFIASMRDAVTSQFMESMRYSPNAAPFIISPLESGEILNLNSALLDLGISPEDLESFKDAMKQLGARRGLNTAERERMHLMPLYSGNVQTMQKGGLVRTTVKDNISKNEYKVENSRDINKAGVLGKDKLTSADKTQLVAIAMDLAALGTSFTGFTPVSAALGVAGTATQFAADVKRDGLDWGDVGSGVLGLGLDALTLIPGAGAAAAAAKGFNKIRKVAPILKTVFLMWGAKDGIIGLSNILSGKGTVDDIRRVSNGLAAGLGIGRKIGEVKASKYKGQPDLDLSGQIQQRRASIDAFASKNESLRNSALDDFVKNNPDVTYHNGSQVHWFENGKIKNYDEAYDGLKNLKDDKLDSFFESLHNVFKSKKGYAIKDLVTKGKNSVKNQYDTVANSKWNPLSDNFVWNTNNRTLGDNPQEIIAAYRANPNAIARLANINPEIADQLRSARLIVDPNYGVRANVSNIFSQRPAPTTVSAAAVSPAPAPAPAPAPTVATPVATQPSRANAYWGPTGMFFQKGGKVKKGRDGYTNTDFEQLNLGLPLLNAAKHLNAWHGRAKESKLKKESIMAARYDDVIPQMEFTSPTSGLSTLYQRKNAEDQALRDAYANVPKTSDYNQYLATANSRAQNDLSRERSFNIDEANLITTNERQRLSEVNNDKLRRAQILSERNRRNASIESALKQEDAARSAGDTQQIEAGLNQTLGYLNQDQLLRDQIRKTEAQNEVEQWYSKERAKIDTDIANDIKRYADANKSTEGYYNNASYTLFKQRLEELMRQYKFKMQTLQVENTMSPLTGSYYKATMHQPANTQRVVGGNQISTPGNGVSKNRKGGRISRSSEDRNNDRILKSIELGNKKIIQLNENILKLLMNALK